MKYESAFSLQVIYVFRINDAEHEGCLKIGKTKLTGNYPNPFILQPNSTELNEIAKNRIDEYTKTAAVHYDLLHTELSFFLQNGSPSSFDDKQIHSILERSGIKQKEFKYSTANEWYITDLETVKNAIKAAKEGRDALNADEKSIDKNPILFRPEQRDAIDSSVKKFQTKGTRMLWNCKMRFGKTLSALQVVKEMKFKRTIIVTHRPVVDAGWYEDFDKIFYDTNYQYGSKNKGESFDNLENSNKANPYIYFASLQDLRGSADVGGKYDKNNQIFKTKWDLVIIDEAHEGTQTELGQNVLKALTKKETCVINLSGTPFNLVGEYNEDEVVNWTYVDEQKAKENWDKDHPCEHNPYGSLPKMNMCIYDLGKVFDGYDASQGELQFNFREFFKTWTGNPALDQKAMPSSASIGQFVHEDDVKRFLDMMVKPDPDTNYPFSTKQYRDIFRHTFWVLPGVKEARAMSELLKKHEVFGNYQIVNVAGEGDEDSEKEEALEAVNIAIGDHPETTYTITLSCGRLTTGVSVKPWTAVFMLYGSVKTKAQTYMQTIFRVQTPAVIGGQQKEECFVFDFAPDRILTALDESVRATSLAKKDKPGTMKTVLSDEDKALLDEFMRFCPVIAYDGSRMVPYNVTLMLEHLKRVQIERVVRNGFEDNALYNDDILMNLDDADINDFNGLKEILGSTKAQPKMNDFEINSQGLDGEIPSSKKDKPEKKPLTPEQQAAKEELQRRKKQKQTAISILRGLSIRFPMLIYGAEIKDENVGITLDNFTQYIDKESWAEFMPQGISMQKFYSLRKYYDPEVFNACGKRIREKARQADSLPPNERIRKITAIFNTFRNPDKETVLTPWRVVNMHMSDTIGGYDFFDETHTYPIDEPRYVDQGKVTYRIFEKEDPRILEINSKSGLYPLYVTYSAYRARLEQWASVGLIADPSKPTEEERIAVWDDVITHNIFVLCKTPMAKQITKRTLVGFRDVQVHAKFVPDLVESLSKQEKREALIKKLQQGKTFWKVKDNMIKFDAIVGNPPYQLTCEADNQNRNPPIYHKFVQLAKDLTPRYVSMVTPARWYTGTWKLDNFPTTMIPDRRVKVLHDYPDESQCFSNVEIKGGVCYFLWDSSNCGPAEIFTHTYNKISYSTRYLQNEWEPIFIRYSEAVSIISKIKKFSEVSFSTIVSSQNPFGFNTAVHGNKTEKENCVPMYLKGRVIEYIEEEKIKNHKEWINQSKVLIPKAGEGGALPNKIIGKPFIAKHNSCCNGTFMVVGPFENETQCQNCITYMQTRLFRFLIAIKKVTQDMNSETCSFVPCQDLNESWTDEKLYAKYGITKEEQEFIESLIKPME